MNRRWICSDVWMDILPSFDHAQLGLKMALLSDRFDVLVDAHFDGKSELTIWRQIRIYKDEGPKPELSVLVDGNFVQFPFPSHPLPNKIRFKNLQIEYIDHSIIEFLRANKQIWDSKGTKLKMPVWDIEIDDEKPIWDVLAHEIWPIFAASIRCLSLTDGAHLDPLCRRISPTFLTDLDQLIAIDFGYLFLHGIADDDKPNATCSASQVLFKWLHTPRKDGKLKELLWTEPELDEGSFDWINSFKETFICATASISYEIFFGVDETTTPTPIEPFELVNEGTKEKLTLKEEEDFSRITIIWLLKRCPIIGETADYGNTKNLNKVTFSLSDCGTGNCIGPLSPPTEEDKEKEEEADESNED